MTFRQNLARFRVGLTHTSSYASPVMFAETTFLALSFTYEWFQRWFFHLPFWAYVSLGMIPMGLTFVWFSWWNGSAGGTATMEFRWIADVVIDRMLERGIVVKQEEQK